MNDLTNAIDNTAGVDSLVALVASLHYSQTGLGRSSFVVTSKGQEVKTGFKVIDARSLVISNNLDGTINPKFPAELQPRDRTRMSSKIQVSKIAGNLRPAQLSDSGLSSHGAPIVGADNVVESGNGRSMGILRAYEQGQADSYRQYLIEHAADYGLKAADIEKMAMPVLVRERVTDVDRAKFARDSNQSDLQEMAASEKAFSDAEMLSENLMAMFMPSDEGNLLARSNDGFIKAFMREIGDTASAGLLTADGRPTKQLIDRIQNAIFAKAYKDERLVKMVAEEPDPDMRNILTALNTAASDFAQMQMLSGDAHKDAVNGLIGGVEAVDGLDKQAIVALQDAINLVRQAKDNGQHIQEVIAQRGLFGESSPESEALALFIVSNNRSPKRIGAAFKKMAQKINDELIHQQQAMGDMFGGGDVSLGGVLTAVSDEIEVEFGEGKGINFAMFESAPGRMSSKAYIQKMIDDSKTAQDLISAIRQAAKIKQNWPTYADPLYQLKNVVFIPNNETLYRWVENYSDDILLAMAESAKISPVYRDALRHAALNDREPPALNDERNVPGSIVWLRRHSAERGNLELVVERLHQVENLIPDDISFEEVKELVTAWVEGTQSNPATRAKISAYSTKKIGAAGNIQQLIAALQNTVSYAKKEAGDITGVMAAGKAIAESVGLTAEISLADKTAAYLDALAQLKRLALMVDPQDRHNVIHDADFYTEQINKVIDRPEKLVPYLEQVFSPHGGGLKMGVDHLAFSIHRAEDIGNSDMTLFDDLQAMFKPGGLPPAISKIIHGKVQAAFNQVLSTSPVTAEQSKEWAGKLTSVGGAIELAAQDREWRPGYDVREITAKAWQMTGGNISSLKAFEHASGVRAFASNPLGKVVIDGSMAPDSTVWHEIGHHIEFSNSHLLEKARAFIKSKARIPLHYNNAGAHGEPEYWVKTSLSHSYMSKIYMENRVNKDRKSGRGKLFKSAPPALSKCVYTEIFSMGMQMYADQKGAVKSIANNDGIIEFVLGCLKEIQYAG